MRWIWELNSNATYYFIAHFTTQSLQMCHEIWTKYNEIPDFRLFVPPSYPANYIIYIPPACCLLINQSLAIQPPLGKGKSPHSFVSNWISSGLIIPCESLSMMIISYVVQCSCRTHLMSTISAAMNWLCHPPHIYYHCCFLPNFRHSLSLLFKRHRPHQA